MTPARVLWELERLAARLGVAVRVEALGQEQFAGRGGLCWLRGKPLVLIDESLRVSERSALLARALACFDVEGVSMPPVVREMVASSPRHDHRADGAGGRDC